MSSANQYVIVKFGALHWSYNTGSNTADAVNFALSNHDLEITDISLTDRDDTDWLLFIDTATDVIWDLKLLASWSSAERLPDVARLIRGVADAFQQYDYGQCSTGRRPAHQELQNNAFQQYDYGQWSTVTLKSVGCKYMYIVNPIFIIVWC